MPLELSSPTAAWRGSSDGIAVLFRHNSRNGSVRGLPDLCSLGIARVSLLCGVGVVSPRNGLALYFFDSAAVSLEESLSVFKLRFSGSPNWTPYSRTSHRKVRNTVHLGPPEQLFVL